MTPREIIAKCLPSHPAIDRGQWADEILTSLAFSGYRILGPGELDPETLEKCAEVAEEDASYEQTEWGMGHRDACNSIANAIRALAKEKQVC